MPTGKYERTPNMIENYKRAAHVRIYTEKGRQKISEAQKGNKNAKGKRSQAFCERMKEASIGNCSHLGHEHSEDIRKKISESRKGITAKELNPNWKGGLTLQNKIERDRFSKTVRKKVFIRDNYICQICKKHGGIVHVDHIKKWSEYPELRFSIENCRTLCVSCHYFITFSKPITEGVVWGLGLTAHRKELS